MVDLNRLALVVVKPDGVEQRLTGDVLHWLDARGFRLLTLAEVLLTPQRRARLYATTSTGGTLDWDLNAVLYKLGPVHAILLESKPVADWSSAADRLSRGLKGHFVPARAGAGSIRADLGALNPIFNLAHATDGPEHLDRETRALFDLPVEDLVTGARGMDETNERLLPARPFGLWSTVARTLNEWLVGRVGPALGPPLTALGWPADELGPRLAALRSADQVWRKLLTTVDRDTDPAVVETLAGIRTGETSYDVFAAGLPGSPWPGYLTYTTLRYLDLCLGDK